MRPAGFFVLRSPLLCFDSVRTLSEGLEAVATVGDAVALAAAIDRDRARVQNELRARVQQPAIRDAIFVASPDLDLAIDGWLSNPTGERAAATERALLRYVIRMAARATPFGLFAGSGVGTIAEQTHLAVPAPHECRRHTRLDMDYLVLLADALSREPALAQSIGYSANSSLYRSADRWRYVETRLEEKTRSHHLVAVEDSGALTATLDRARDGATRGALAMALVDDEVAASEADAFVGELIESQILVPDTECPLTGPEPLAELERLTRRDAASHAMADRLASIGAELEAIDQAGIGVSPARYRALADQLGSLPAKVDLARLFQVDLVKPSPAATLGRDVVDEIRHGLDILRRLTPAGDHHQLGKFRAAFAGRYEGRRVSLVEALDEESGVGAALVEGAERDASPLLRGLDFPDTPVTTIPWSKRESGLLSRVGEALLAGRHELALTENDIDELTTPDVPALPDAFAVMATLIAPKEAEAKRDWRVLLHYAGGPSGAALLGRFCHADPELLAHVRQHLRDEEALDPDARYAEIVHLPEGRLGNILLRPVLRDCEIPYLGRSGAPRDRQIPVEDLTLALVDGGFVLRSRRLGCRVVPRLTSAHNFSHGSLGMYRFLCLLQSERCLAGCRWIWGALGALPFLPRVTSGRLVLARAMWRVTREEIRALNAGSGADRYAAVQAWRARRRLPRWIVLADHDNTLPIDLDNVVAVETLLHLLKPREGATLEEMYPGPDELCAGGSDGRYVHELLIPFCGNAETTKTLETRKSGRSPALSVQPGDAIRRTFAPGSEWVYAKLYAGSGLADRLLSDVIGPISRALLASGTIDRWFFIRYADPDEHVRWRMRVAPKGRLANVRRRVEAAAAGLITDGRVRRLVFDTYEREIERYGGGKGIDIAEEFFSIDSEAVIDFLAAAGSTDAAADLRWQAATVSVDSLLEDMGLDLDAKHALMQKLREQFGREFKADAALGRQLAAKFRGARAKLEAMFQSVGVSDSAPDWRTALSERSTRSRPLLNLLQSSAQAGQLTATILELAESFVHMHLNRLFRAQQRAHELVIYDFLVLPVPSAARAGERATPDRRRARRGSTDTSLPLHRVAPRRVPHRAPQPPPEFVAHTAARQSRVS